jgi:hypothetical protein
MTKNKIKKHDVRYRYEPGSCVICGQGTDTGFASKGQAEWHMVTLIMKLGLREEEASTLVSIGTGNEPGTVLDGRFVLGYELCGTCAEKRGVPVAPAVDGAILPCITHRDCTS